MQPNLDDGRELRGPSSRKSQVVELIVRINFYRFSPSSVRPQNLRS